MPSFGVLLQIGEFLLEFENWPTNKQLALDPQRVFCQRFVLRIVLLDLCGCSLLRNLRDLKNHCKERAAGLKTLFGPKSEGKNHRDKPVATHGMS